MLPTVPPTNFQPNFSPRATDPQNPLHLQNWKIRVPEAHAVCQKQSRLRTSPRLPGQVDRADEVDLGHFPHRRPLSRCLLLLPHDEDVSRGRRLEGLQEHNRQRRIRSRGSQVH